MMLRSRIALALAIAGTMLTVGQVLAQPATVYVFNGGTPQNPDRDGYNQNCKGWIFQNMGFLGPHGEPPTINGNNVVRSDGTVVGTVIRDSNNNIIGYRNSDGTKEAYNVDTSATTRQAWLRVADHGELVIAKHGTTVTEGEGDDERITGTGVTLDGGRSYPGFRPTGGRGSGTGSGGTPYELPGRDGAGIGVYLNNCYSSHDPDGADGPRRSVTDTAKDIPGVDDDRVRGNDGVIYKGPSYSWTSEDAANDPRVQAALEHCAEDAGFTKQNDAGQKVGDPAAWIASLPFEQQRQALVDCVNAARIPGITINVSYTKGTTACGDDGCAYYTPVELIDPTGGQITYQASPERPFVDLFIPPGAVEQQSPIALRVLSPQSDLPPLPTGMRPVCAIAWVDRYDHQPLQFFVPAMVGMSFLPGPEMPIGMFTVEGGQWAPYPASIDPTGMVVTQIQGARVLAILEPAPPPPPPPCPADFNNDGLVNSQDFFDFLTAFFARNPNADFNNDGRVNSQDFFDFLTEFFTGCH